MTGSEIQRWLVDRIPPPPSHPPHGHPPAPTLPITHSPFTGGLIFSAQSSSTHDIMHSFSLSSVHTQSVSLKLYSHRSPIIPSDTSSPIIPLCDKSRCQHHFLWACDGFNTSTVTTPESRATNKWRTTRLRPDGSRLEVGGTSWKLVTPPRSSLKVYFQKKIFLPGDPWSF